ncbi:hypothetical protein FB567DRAFT_115609 [Paraphoma chrysanthemicola]|uniref:Phosphatidylcholine-sterol O-acyltransferase-like protein n=1 Tax=Paraphoma chrysanthemicola TaxID=798071 RepID=A0A8K0R0G8_9PLEO|nr:hypothetical protein FB567DRAFT_115609 [Paraphoma chrysanthemicola]
MAAVDSGTSTPQSRRQNALADIQFASIIDDDLTPSEDESPEEQSLQLEHVQSAIGISIGRQQTRLTSPKTPAAEKAAALDETDGGVLFGDFEERIEPAADPSTPRTPRTPLNNDVEDAVTQPLTQAQVLTAPPAQLPESLERLPSPWRAGPKIFQDKPSDHRAILRQNLQSGHRRRASSNGSMGEAVRKYLPFSLPSLPKTYKDLHFSLPSFSALSLDGQTAPRGTERQRRETFAHTSSASSIPQQDGGLLRRRSQREASSPAAQSSTAPIPQREFGTDSESTIAAPNVRPSSERPMPRLRRSNSEGSLLVYRAKSFASSLGDDSRFESVQEQVNSRLKAIRDSWQDANFKFPSPTLPNFNFNYRDDLFKNRNGSPSTKPRDVDDAITHKVSLRARGSSSTSQSAPLRSKLKRPSTATAADVETHPFFSQALQELEGDLVILGGYRGSILRSAEPPNRQLWVPIKVGLNLRKVDLEVPFDAKADERMEETIIPSGMLKHIGPVDISKRLFKRLRASDNARSGKLRVHDYGYDWRLSPHFLSRRMIQFLESLPCNQPDVPREKRGAIVVAHSLGGLITRHVINQRPDLVASVVYAGVPQRCINILGPFRNGDDVLFSSRVLTAQVNFSIRTSFALLPLDGKCFINKQTKEEYPIDFFDPKTWTDYRLSPCLGPALPRPDPPKDSTLSVSGLLNAMSQALPTFPSRKFSISKGSQSNSSGTVGDTMRGAADVARNAVSEGGAESAGMGPQMAQGQSPSTQTSSEPNPATAVTIPYDKAVEYLTRTLAEIKKFKQELDHIPAHTETNSYPPIALIYGKTTPTVYGAKVESREAIPRADCYDELAFASGDGVVLARAAMVPDGYSVVRGGVVSSERGHITLLGDLEAVGRCLVAVMAARRSGVGIGEAGIRERKQRSGDEGLGIRNALPITA